MAGLSAKMEMQTYENAGIVSLNLDADDEEVPNDIPALGLLQGILHGVQEHSEREIGNSLPGWNQ